MKMHPRFPELRVGPAIRRNHMTIYPLYPAQRLLFSDAERGPEFRAAAYRERAKLKNFGGRQATRAIPMISNTSSTRALFLPGDSVGKHSILTTAILVPPGASVRVPSLCCGPARGGGGNRIRLAVGAVGWIAVGGDQWQMHLFGHQEAARQAGLRQWAICANHGPVPARSEIEAFAGLIYHLPWKRVKSATPRGTDWVAQVKSVQAGALFLGKHLIHLFSVRTL